MAETITFDRDGKTHVAVVGDPRIPAKDALTVVHEGERFTISIGLGPGKFSFIAHPVEIDQRVQMARLGEHLNAIRDLTAGATRIRKADLEAIHGHVNAARAHLKSIEIAQAREER